MDEHRKWFAREMLPLAYRLQLLPMVLKKRDVEILVTLYGLEGDPPITLTKAGSSLGITPQRVGEIRDSALARLMRELRRGEWPRDPLRDLPEHPRRYHVIVTARNEAHAKEIAAALKQLKPELEPRVGWKQPAHSRYATTSSKSPIPCGLAIDDLDLSDVARGLLIREGIKTAGELRQTPLEKLHSIRGISRVLASVLRQRELVTDL